MLIRRAIICIFLLLSCVGGTFGQAPVVGFSANTTVGCGFLAVSFTDLSTNNPTSWSWKFGNGNSSGQQNPTNAYTSPGIYSVTLTASNSSGSSTKIWQNYIRVFNPPTPLFSTSPLSICAGSSANFTDHSTPGESAISQWLWDFGDGNSSGSQNASNTYASSGFYTVALTVTDANGCIKKLVSPVPLVVTPNPVADFSGSPFQFCTIPKTVNFTSSSTGSGLSYQWNFGDGGSGTGAGPGHSYTAFGTYSVSLTVTDLYGCSNTKVKSSYINIADFQADFSATPRVGCDSVVAAFTDLSVPPASSWKWIFGDGATSTVKDTAHNYKVDGSFTVKLIATNSAGCMDTATKVNYVVVNPLPNVIFSADKTDTCGIPYVVKFTDNTTGAAQWQWDFGDGHTSSQKNPTNTYTSFGNYDVSLTVIDGNGCTSTAVTYIHINAPQAWIHRSCECSYWCPGPYLPFEGCIPITASPISSCSSPGSGGSINSWQWIFDNGYTTTSPTPATQTYTAVGVYSASLTITTTNGCSASFSTVVARAGIAPVATFTSNVTVGCYPLEVHFTDLSTVSLAGENVNDWEWIMGDGDTLYSQNPVHIYRDTGYFTVKLIAYFNGCPNSHSISNYIHVLPPKTSYTVTPNIGCSVPVNINLIEGSQGAHTWRWDFGDGGTSLLKNPGTHTYINPGFYTIKLVTTNTLVNSPFGCADSLINQVEIANTKPGYTSVQTGICSPSTGTFSDTSTFYSSAPILIWSWNFGDGHSASGTNNPIPGGYDNGLTTGTSFRTPVHTYALAGTFSVTLTTLDLLGCSQNIKKQVISIRPDPTPLFTAVPTMGCRPITAAFFNSSYSATPGKIIQYTWNFGDGSPVDNTVNPTHLYATRGSYSVSLSLVDSLGCSHTLTKSNYINPTFPYTNFAFNTNTCNNVPAQFINTTTPLAGLSYLWTFGDGSTSTATHPLHTFSVDTTTTFTVTLKARDANGCDSTISRTINVVQPWADFGALQTVADCPPFVVSFKDSSSSDVAAWQWDFGDGAGSTLKNPLHTFNNGGTYSVKLIATTNGLCRDTMEIPDMITVGGPSGSFNFSPSTGCAPLTVEFFATAKKTEIYQWIFGDGGTATGNPVSHIYTYANTFNPILLITDSLDGSGDTIRCTVQIPSPSGIYVPGPNIDFSSDKQTSCTPTSVTFTNLTSPLSGTETWLWDFGDGQTSTDKDPAAHFYAGGNYAVTLTVLIDSCVYVVSKADFISVFAPPQIAIVSSVSSGCTPLKIYFTVDTTTVNYPVSSWSWDFGDGNTSKLRDPVYTYKTGGTYSVSLFVVFSSSCSATYSLDHTIIVFDSPVADFDLEAVIAGNYISSIRFYNYSQDAIAYLWDFGDGSNSTVTNPEHSYNTDGLFDIKLIAYSLNGCTDTVVKNEYIYFEIRMPNIFTPDGDGVNDYFNLLIPGLLKDFDLAVYDRWGKQVFQSSDYKNNWDGKNPYGKPVDNGTYYYVLKYHEKYAWYGWVMVVNSQ